MEPLGLSIPDTCRALGGTERPLSTATIYRMLARGELTKAKIGGRTLVTMDSIKARLEAGVREAAA